MANVREGAYKGSGKRFAIVVSRFNSFITKHLLEACENTLVRHGVRKQDIEILWVPGAMEIALIARRVAERGKVHAVICLGCVIRGQTPHFDLVAQETARSIAEVGHTTGIPTLFGVIVANTLEQAIERAGSKLGNRGMDAALAAIEMADLLNLLEGRAPAPARPAGGRTTQSLFGRAPRTGKDGQKRLSKPPSSRRKSSKSARF